MECHGDEELKPEYWKHRDSVGDRGSAASVQFDKLTDCQNRHSLESKEEYEL